MIVKKPDGFYVQSEKGKNLGGPYQSREAAEKRLAQVEFFKNLDKSKGDPGSLRSKVRRRGLLSGR